MKNENEKSLETLTVQLDNGSIINTFVDPDTVYPIGGGIYKIHTDKSANTLSMPVEDLLRDIVD